MVLASEQQINELVDMNAAEEPQNFEIWKKTPAEVFT